MSCSQCMDYKPFYPVPYERYQCPKCGQRWILAAVSPGAYWEPLETHEAEKAAADELIAEFLTKREENT